MQEKFDIVVVGAGLVGLTAALACAKKGAKVCILDQKKPNIKEDKRASAISASSFVLLKKLGVTDFLVGNIQAIDKILISDSRVGRKNKFNLKFQNLNHANYKGYMIDNSILKNALLKTVKKIDGITIKAPVKILKTSTNSSKIKINLDNNSIIDASLLVAADGKNSNFRKSADISVRFTHYRQSAIVTTIGHEFVHNGSAHQFFFPGGPLALLPLTKNRSSIVWSDSSLASDAAMSLNDSDFIDELSHRINGLLGKIKLLGPRQIFPLNLQMANRYTAKRLVLVGDAAHSIHPIAGQGLNLGLRDAAALADNVALSIRENIDLGSEVIQEYEKWRISDNNKLGITTDILNRLFSNKNSSLRFVRRLGLNGVNHSELLKTFFIEEASGLTGELPTLMIEN
ncbi:MAG: UbiH/UbiF/VisC/COQ6 family ubiquinone biosynthesis hydroxylase [Hellea sp.]|jgi:2-octaprenyl-6-methoxyphenol hydroxylase|nr:UbiH/UbiF/VisC/COQ6 family ubiquinone biosynthesis hydroxylase [Hellea sp.]